MCLSLWFRFQNKLGLIHCKCSFHHGWSVLLFSRGSFCVVREPWPFSVCLCANWPPFLWSLRITTFFPLCGKGILLKAVEVKHRLFWAQKVADKVKLSKWTGAFVPEKNTVLGSNWLPPPVVIAVKIPLPTSPSAVECEDGVDRWAPCRSKGVIGRQPCVLSLPSLYLCQLKPVFTLGHLSTLHTRFRQKI